MASIDCIMPLWLYNTCSTSLHSKLNADIDLCHANNIQFFICRSCSIFFVKFHLQSAVQLKCIGMVANQLFFATSRRFFQLLQGAPLCFVPLL